MSLTTMEPTPTWDEASFSETVETFASIADDIDVLVWGGDWCPDCRAVLPDFAAALDAAGVPESSVETIDVDRDKNGPLVEEYGVELIPTIVIEHDGKEIARFVESESRPAAVYLADELRDAGLET